MKVILDENLPHGLKRLLSDHDVSTVQDEGWSGITNGELIDRIDGEFDAMLTADKNLRYQQNLTNRQVAIIELPSNRWPLLKDLSEKLLAAIDSTTSGSYQIVTA